MTVVEQTFGIYLTWHFKAELSEVYKSPTKAGPSPGLLSSFVYALHNVIQENALTTLHLLLFNLVLEELAYSSLEFARPPTFQPQVLKSSIAQTTRIITVLPTTVV